MEFRELDSFLAVARMKSFSAAARYLYLSQSAVSQRVAALEKDLGFPLFTREGGHVKLTRAGEYLAMRLRGMRDAHADSIERARWLAANDEINLSVGYDGLLAEPWIGEAFLEFRRRGVLGTPVRLYREGLPALTEKFIDGVLDVIVTLDIEVEHVADVVFVPLACGRPCVYVSPEHPFAAQSAVTVDEVLAEEVLGAYAYPRDRALSRMGDRISQMGLDGDQLMACHDADAAMMAARVGQGIFVASRLCDAYAERLGLIPVDIDVAVPDVKLGIAYKNEAPVVTAFVDCCRTVLGSGRVR